MNTYIEYGLTTVIIIIIIIIIKYCVGYQILMYQLMN